MKIIYFIVLFILLLLVILFVVKTSISLIITPNIIKLYVFKIKIFSLKGSKLYEKMIDSETKMIKEKDKNKYLYLHLLNYIHLNKLEINQGLKTRHDVLSILYGIKNIIENIDYHNKIKINLSSSYLDTIIKIKINFYLGTVLLNFLLIRRQINESKKHSWFLYRYYK